MERLMNKRPNILLIVMDSVRSSNLSCYGYHRPTTPNIDAFARQGTLFENTVSEGCWTLPVHTSLFTGLYALNHGVTISKSALPENHPTLAHRLREAGYQTCCLTSNAYISPNTGLTNGFDTVEEVWRITSPRGIKRTKMSQLKMQLRKLGLIGAPLIVALRLLSRLRRILKGQKTKSDKGAALTNQLAEKWLANRSADKPFFLFINYMECHEKYEPTAPYDRKFMPQQYSKWRVSQVSPDKKHVLKGSEKRKKEDVEIMTALYDGELNYLDQKISELLAALNSNSLLDDTVVVITSDHGDSLGEHNELGHRMVLYEQLVHVPLIVRYPKIFKSGDRVPNLVQLADLFPTLLELGGVTSQKEKSNGFLSLCNLENLGRREFVVAENTAPKSLSSMEMKAIRNERYKLIWKSNDELELYDLLHDPLEEKNLIREQPAEAERLRQYLEKWKGAHAFQLESREAVFDDELSERLRALGYVN
jgi:arylsulfatase A-like enzyme